MIYKSYLAERDIKILDKNLLLFFGENLGLQNDFKKSIKLHNSDAEIINLYQEEIIKNEEILSNEILNVSLFQDKKIFFINNTNDKILELIKNIEDKIENKIIVLFSGILEKKSKLRDYFEKSKITGIVACYQDNEITIKKIINKELGDFSGLSSEAINMIHNSCNLDRDKLYNEIEKIIAFFTDKKIEIEKLENLLNLKTNEDFNILKDEALCGNRKETNKLLSETTIDGDKNILYLNILNQRLLKLDEAFKLARETNKDNAINQLKPPIFWKDKPNFLVQINKWSSDKIRLSLNKTFNLEKKIKSNAFINKNILLKKLLVDICDLANS